MKVWDAVWLNDEIELLLWRLELLRDVVDEFVIVEGDMTFSGAAKVSCFLAHEARIRAVAPSVHFVVVPLPVQADDPWERENAQRRGLAAALEELTQPGDLLIVADVDEVPRPDVVRHLSAHLDRPVRLHMQPCNYYANWVQVEPWRNSAWAYRHGQHVGHQMLRVHLGSPHSDWDGYIEEYVSDAGWHLSFMGGPRAVRRKLMAYSHQEHNTDADAFPGHLERCFDHGVHFLGSVLLTKLRRSEMDAELLTLGREQPDMLRFEDPRSGASRRAFRTWTWLRRSGRVPQTSRSWLDRHPSVLRAVLGAPLLLLDLARTLKRRRTTQPSWPTSRQWTGPG
nr:hypothetical protein [Aeromicrobium sp.]